MRKWQIRLATEIEADTSEDALVALMSYIDPHVDISFDVETEEVTPLEGAFIVDSWTRLEA